MKDVEEWQPPDPLSWWKFSWLHREVRELHERNRELAERNRELGRLLGLVLDEQMKEER